MKKIGTLLLTLALAFSLSATAYAQGNVKYDGDSIGFIFEPGTEQSLTSLFENFQDVMPGDSLTEQVVIRNITKNYKIKVYMRALGAQRNTDEFLSQMKLTVKLNNSSTLFEAPADQTAQLTDWVYLGTLYYNGNATLDVTLDVPIEMGNDYMNEIGYFDWEFKVEEIPVNAPQTGDESNVLLYGVVMLLSLSGMAAILPRLKHREEN